MSNENIAGQTSGSQNLAPACPLSGSAQISGTTAVASNGINTIHLNLALQDCGNSNTSYALAFTGSLTWDGTFGASSPNAVTFRSTSLNVVGSVKRYDAPTLSESCPAALTDTYNKVSSTQSGWLSGALCGRAVTD